MTSPPPEKSIRAIKKDLLARLCSMEWQRTGEDLAGVSARRAVNPLIGFLCRTEGQIRWRAVMILGELVSRLYATEPESARVIMRRLMWHLNDESGGIGWGVPEAMGEIMARDGQGLAREYAAILCSYLDPGKNFLELPALRRGVVWGLARLARVRPELVSPAWPHLLGELDSPDGPLRGLAAMALGILKDPAARQGLEQRKDDFEPMVVFDGRELATHTVGELASRALEELD